jgi:hypothetical protein
MEVPQGPKSILENMLKEVAESWKWVFGVDQGGFKTFLDPQQKQIWRAYLRVVLNLPCKDLNTKYLIRNLK